MARGPEGSRFFRHNRMTIDSAFAAIVTPFSPDCPAKGSKEN
jgi:hypothetical protein